VKQRNWLVNLLIKPWRLFCALWFNSAPLRYSFIGAWNFFFTGVLYLFLIYIFGKEKYQLALGLTFVLSTMQSFVTQRRWVWRDSLQTCSKLLLFFSGSCLQYLLGSSILFFAVNVLKLNATFVQLPVMFTIVTLFYVFNKSWVFRQRVDKD